MLNSYRRAFSLIELVFVIVVIGILTSVALPKFLIVADDAHTSKIQAFVGSLNKTVGPTIWSSLQRKYPAAQGSVTSAVLPVNSQYNTIFDTSNPPAGLADDAQVEAIPDELILSTPGQIDLTLCNVPTTGATDAQITGGTSVANATIGTSTYDIVCSSGSTDLSPHFYLVDNSSGTPIIIVR